MHYLELRSSARPSVDTQFSNVRSKLVSLGSTYAKSERFFPVDYLALMLEQHACERRWIVYSVHRLLAEMGVPTTLLFKIYDMMFKAKVCCLLGCRREEGEPYQS